MSSEPPPPLDWASLPREEAMMRSLVLPCRFFPYDVMSPDETPWGLVLPAAQ